MRFVVSLLFAIAVFAAAPTPARAQDTGTISAEGVASINGTHWQGETRWTDGATYEWTLFFRPDGVVEYGYNGASYDNGRWLQNDAVVLVHTNQYYAVLLGTLSGDTISGATHNRVGESGVFTFRAQDARAPARSK